jgi:tetratricopeptide (TPR) repeat protein
MVSPLRHSRYILLLLLLLSPLVSRAVDQGEAESMVASAGDGIEEAYLAVVEAERAGGNVTELVSSLNDAIALFEMAETRLGSGEYEEAFEYAEEVLQRSNLIKEEAQSLKTMAELRAAIEFRNKLVLGITISFFVIIFGYAGWFYFKRYYVNKIAETKPEVVAPESET